MGDEVGGEVNNNPGSPPSGDSAFGCSTGDDVDTTLAVGAGLGASVRPVGEAVIDGEDEGLKVGETVGVAVGPWGTSAWQTAPCPLNSNVLHRGMFASNC